MNAKTTKFLAVLAVLAMAFATVVAFSPVGSDATAEQSVWTVPDDGTKSSLVLGSDVIVPADGDTIDGAKAYYVNEDMSLVLSADADESQGATLILLKKGVTLNTEVPEKHDHTISYAILGVTESTNESGDTVLTFFGNYKGTNFEKWVGTDNKGFNYPTTWDDILGNQTIGMASDRNGGHFNFMSDVNMSDPNKDAVYICYADTDLAFYGNSANFFGEFKYNYQYSQPSDEGAIWKMNEATGTIGSFGEANKAELKEFIGVMKMGSDNTITIDSWRSGDITVTKGGILFGENAYIPEGATLTFAQGTTVPATTFQYKDQYGDIHAFTTGAELNVEMGGFSITAKSHGDEIGENNIDVSGYVSLTAETELKFKGNAILSGFIYTNFEASGYDLTIIGEENTSGKGDIADVKIAGLQVAGPGNVTLGSSVLVMENTSFLVKGNLTVQAVLKVAEKAVVKTEGTLATERGTSQTDALQGVWNAGKVNANTYEPGDVTLYSVYMSTKAIGGVFMQGTKEYVGEIDDAYGAYIYITGKGKVNLASGITINNGLYKYYTLILAAFNDVIAVTADYENKYPVDVTLDGKIASEAEKNVKAATYRDVVWESASNAILTIDIPETYNVTIVKDYNAETGKSTAYWTSDDIEISYVDKSGTKQTVIIGNEGVVELICEVEYTITGLTETSNYSFEEPTLKLGKDNLTKDSQIAGSFEMIRNISGEPIVIVVTEGIASVITVNLDNTEGMDVVEGETPILYYIINEDDEETVYYSAEEGGMTIELFSNDKITFRVAEPDFYHLEFGTIEGWQQAPVLVGAVPADNQEPVKEAVPGITGAAAVTLPVVVKADTGSVSLKIVDGNDADFTGASFTMTWTKAAPKQTQTNPTTVTGTSSVPVYRAEEITISWDDKEGYRQYLLVNGTQVAGNDVNEYNLTVTADLYAQDSKGIVLKVVAINYVSVTNSDDNFSFLIYDNDVAKNGVAVLKAPTEEEEAAGAEDESTVEKAIEQIPKNRVKIALLDTDETSATYGQPLPGYRILSWGYTLTYADETTLDGTVIGDTQLFNFKDGENENKNVVSMEIYAINAEAQKYIVKTLEGSHIYWGHFAETEVAGKTMLVFATTDPEYRINKISVYKEEGDLVKGEIIYDRISKVEGSDDTWSFKMPACNVIIEAEVVDDEYTATFVNWDGTVLYTYKEDAGKTPEYKGETPTKESEQGIAYEFAGWEPELGAITEDTTYTAVFTEKLITSENVVVGIAQDKETNDIIFYIDARDKLPIASGTITAMISYTFEDEFGGVSTDSVEITIEYTGSTTTFATEEISYDDLVEALGENVSGIFGIWGTFAFEDAEGDLNATAYNPVQEA